MSKHKRPKSVENKLDQSTHIEQRDKVKENFNIRSFKWTEKQQKFIDLALDKNTKILAVSGPPGCSKTLLAVYCSLLLISEKKIGELVYYRSLVQSKDSETGYLPGTLEDRCQFYYVPLYDKLEELLYKNDIKKLVEEKRIKTSPVSMIRGVQHSVSALILDESQNCTLDTIFSLATRVGEHSKLFILGDEKYQNDLGKKSGFAEFCQIYKDDESKANGIQYFQFTSEDIMRSKLVKFLVEKMDNYSNK